MAFPQPYQPGIPTRTDVTAPEHAPAEPYQAGDTPTETDVSLAGHGHPAGSPTEAMPEPGVDGGEPIDLDGDGLYDALVYDTNDDGEPDLRLVDANHDGLVDEYAYDRNHDGRVDWIVQDTDHDGRIDLDMRDDDFDGHLDSLSRDTDGDGSYDYFQ